MSDPTAALFDAISFAARAHRHQVRKDGQTPYAAHPFRVCLVVRHVFGIEDPRVLAAAVLHDTIEDTTTDFDDLAERYGTDVAGWVADLSKDMRLPESEREAAYLARLAAADWQVIVCKLADGYDNLSDFAALPPDRRRRQVRRTEEFLDAVRGAVPPEATVAYELTRAKVDAIRETFAVFPDDPE